TVFNFHALALLGVTLAVICSLCSCQPDEDVLNPSLDRAILTTRTPAPDVPAILQVPAGQEVSLHVYAQGVQVYVCTETSPGIFAWVFKEPIATLYANPGFNGERGIHYAGPTWESNSGSKVVGTRLQGVTVDPTAIPWLLLGAVSSQGPGILEGTTFIQRINTAGGKAPATGATSSNVGEQIEVPYTAEYYFYKPA
ncbi:MAG TPA: DUF3455 domain-containing protein, partial [Saprospiraceae bacterium]|nr:DUF3455 domain-containing protein [Saprospiraceae bacterium]